MKFLLPFRRIATLPIASLLLITAAAALRPVCATELKTESEAERYVLEQVQKGEHADLESRFPKETFPESKRELSASFIADLLTSRDGKLKIHPHGIWIEHAVISGKVDLESQEIPHDVVFRGCTFVEDVNFFGSNFAKGLELSGCTFKGLVTFYGAFVRRDFRIYESRFEDSSTFKAVQVGGVFVADDSTFQTNVYFTGIRVNDRFSARRCTFEAFMVDFSGAHFADVLLNEAHFSKFLTIDFTRMQADFISFDDVEVRPATESSRIILQQMTFKVLSPADTEKLQFLFSHYDPGFYADLETSFRAHGYREEADKVFIANKRAERRENCKNFWECNRRAWAWSVFQDSLAGYGKSLQNLLYWSLGFLVIGILVFRGENGMRLKDEKDAPHYAGRYNAFWYSLDLFLPIIKLGEADVWTPKDDRRWANLYRKVHIIIGSLFVPIGLAAWTGIIK